MLLGHDVGMRHGAGIEMIAGEGDRPLEFAGCDQRVDRERQLRALAMAEPGDARRQALERHVLPRQADPVGDDLVVREHLQQQIVDAGDVAFLARQRHPAEGADGAGKQRPQIGLGEDRDVEGVVDAAFACAWVRIRLPLSKTSAPFAWKSSMARTWSTIEARLAAISCPCPSTRSRLTSSRLMPFGT